MTKPANTSQPANPYSLPEPWDLVAAGYAETTMKSLGQYAAEAVKRAELKPQWDVLDVACGPGTVPLMIASRVRRVSALDFSADMLRVLQAEIQRHGILNIEAHSGDGQALPYEDASFDAAFSMFGLMFFPDRKKGFQELRRTLKKGGRAFVSAWAPIDQSPLMKTMFEAVQKITGEPALPSKTIAALEDPAVFRREMEGAGFRQVDIVPVTKYFAYLTVDHFWSDMVRGSAPLVVLRKKLGEAVWREKEKRAVRYLEKKFTRLPVSLSSDAWLGMGTA